jgi:hypothetical protein
MDDSLRRAAAMRGPMNDTNPNSGRFGLLPSLLEEFFQPSNSEAPRRQFPTRDLASVSRTADLCNS